MEDVLRDTAAYGQPAKSSEDQELWVNTELDRFRNPGKAYDVTMSDNRVLRYQGYQTADGGTLVRLSDVTGQFEIEQNIKRLTAAIEMIDVGVLLFDPEGRLQFSNKDFKGSEKETSA